MALPAIALVSAIAQLAPAIAGLFGKGEKEAEIVANVARAITGTPDNESAVAALAASPDKLIEFQHALLAQKTEFEKFYIDDKADARARDKTFVVAGIRNYRGDFLVGITVVIILAILVIVVRIPELNEYAKGALTTILGVFLNQLTNVFSFEFGTTRKDDESSKKILNDYIKS